MTAIVDARTLPWATTAIALANLAAYLILGTASDFPADPAGAEDGHLPAPSVSDLTFDAFRHPHRSAMAVALVALVPVSAATERILGGIAVASTYTVAGFAAGFVEVLVRSGGGASIGAYGAVTAIIAMWAVTRWRQHHDALLPTVAAIAWCSVMTHVHPTGFRSLATVAAVCIGIYAVSGRRGVR